MNWKDFISTLSRDFRLSENEIAQKCNINQPTINRMARGETNRPYPSTIQLLEEGLKIKIDDSNPNNISYIRLDAEKDYGHKILFFKYPILTNIHAGPSMSFVRENGAEYISLPYPKEENCFALRVQDNSMGQFITTGDIILADMDKSVVSGNVVVARLKDGRQFIRRFRELSHNVIMLYSDNGEYEPITIINSEIEAMFSIVGIWKKL